MTFKDIVERISTINKGVWYYDVSPRFASILSRKLGGATTELAGGFSLGLYVGVVDIFLGFGFAHIDSVCSFHNEVWLIFLCAARPIYVELIGHRTNPFEDFIVGFEYERKIKLGRTVETIFGIIGFFEAYIHKFYNGRFLGRYRLVKIQ